MIEPYFQTPDGRITLYHGDCLEVMKQLEPGSVDAVVTDPPYGIDIMLHPANLNVSSRACVGREYAPVAGNDTEFDPDGAIDEVVYENGKAKAQRVEFCLLKNKDGPKGVVGAWFEPGRFVPQDAHYVEATATPAVYSDYTEPAPWAR